MRQLETLYLPESFGNFHRRGAFSKCANSSKKRTKTVTYLHGQTRPSVSTARNPGKRRCGLNQFAKRSFDIAACYESTRGGHMRLSPGMQIFHNGTPVELLHQVKENKWLVKPLFVVGINRVETFNPHDSYSHLHSEPKVMIRRIGVRL